MGFSRKRRKKSLIQKISFNKLIFFKFIFCFILITSVNIFSFVRFKKEMGTIIDISKELNSTSTFSNEYYYTNNA